MLMTTYATVMFAMMFAVAAYCGGAYCANR